MTPPRAALDRVQSPRRPAPAPERPRHLRVVRGRPAPGRRPPLLLVSLVVAVTATALFALVIANVFLGQAAVTQADLERTADRTRVEVEQLELEVARLRSPSRIAARAAELGLVHPTDVTVLVPAEPARRDGATNEQRAGR